MKTVPERSQIETASLRARRYAELFSLPLRDQNWRGSAGDLAGLGVGSSIDFQDHRKYLAGDDPRHINWQAYARTGDYSLKLYREEVRPVVEIVFDVSGSMFALEEKANRALELVYFCLASAARSGASAHVVIVAGPHGKPVENHAMITHAWTELVERFPESASAAAPNLSAIPFRARSMRVFISDLLFSSSPETIIRALQHNSGRGVILCPYSPAEADPGWDGNYDFVDTEDGNHHDRRVDPSLLKRYLQAYQDHFGRWKAGAIRARAPLARITSTGSFEDAVRVEAIVAGAMHLA